MSKIYPITVNHEVVYEDLQDFPATLYLEGIRRSQRIWFSVDVEGWSVLRSDRYHDNTFIIIIPELSSIESTTLYMHSDDSIAFCTGHLDKPDNIPAVYCEPEGKRMV